MTPIPPVKIQPAIPTIHIPRYSSSELPAALLRAIPMNPLNARAVAPQSCAHVLMNPMTEDVLAGPNVSETAVVIKGNILIVIPITHAIAARAHVDVTPMDSN